MLRTKNNAAKTAPAFAARAAALALIAASFSLAGCGGLDKSGFVPKPSVNAAAAVTEQAGEGRSQFPLPGPVSMTAPKHFWTALSLSGEFVQIRSTHPDNNQYSSLSKLDVKGLDSGVTVSKNRTQCASFVSRLLQKLYPEVDTSDEWKAKFGTIANPEHIDSPFAKDYYDKIVGPSNEFFASRVLKVSDMRPGDVIALRYSNVTSTDSTGHIALVGSGKLTKTAGTDYYDVPIIDCTSDTHGTGDQRGTTDTSFDDGVGSAKLRIHVDANDQIIGHRWKPESTSKYWPHTETVSAGVPTKQIAVGRLKFQTQQTVTIKLF